MLFGLLGLLGLLGLFRVRVIKVIRVIRLLGLSFLRVISMLPARCALRDLFFDFSFTLFLHQRLMNGGLVPAI